MITIQIIMGSTRPGRKSEAIAKWLQGVIKARKEAEVTFELIDLRDYPLPFYNEPVGAGMLAQSGYTDEVAKKWAAKVAEADGFVFITPEYNHGYSAVLKNALDYVYAAWNNKAVGFVSYGSAAGGSRAVEQLRQVAGELQLFDIREQVIMPFVWEKIKENGTLVDEGDHYKHAANAMLDQLIKHTKSLQQFRQSLK